MTDSSNPYEPPHAPADDDPTWTERWSRLYSVFRPQSTVQRFLSGRRIWHCGVVFRLDPRNPTAVIASLPLAVDDEEHVRRNVLEAQRMFVELLTIYPQLVDAFRSRELVISMVSFYEDLDEELHRVIIPATEWHTDLGSSTD